MFECVQPVYFGSRLSLLWSVWREVPGREGYKRKGTGGGGQAPDYRGDPVGVKAGIDCLK